MSLASTALQFEPVCEVADPWAWAYSNEVKLVGAAFKHEGHEFQVEPMRARTKNVTVRKATQMPFTEGAVLKVLHSLI